MIIPKDNQEVFYKWVEAFYGAKVKIHDTPIRGEYARFMVGERLVIVREHQRDVSSGQSLEVWSGDQDRIEEMTEHYAIFLRKVMAQSNEESNN